MSATGTRQCTDTKERQNTGRRVAGGSPRFTGICTYRLRKTSRFSPGKFIKNLGNKVATTLRSVPMRKRSSSTKVSSSVRSNPFVTPVDSQRTEAIQDCIEFINSSSSLQRSNSVSANPS